MVSTDFAHREQRMTSTAGEPRIGEPIAKLDEEVDEVLDELESERSAAEDEKEGRMVV
jgi:hypothetical protein